MLADSGGQVSQKSPAQYTDSSSTAVGMGLGAFAGASGMMASAFSARVWTLVMLAVSVPCDSGHLRDGASRFRLHGARACDADEGGCVPGMARREGCAQAHR